MVSFPVARGYLVFPKFINFVSKLLLIYDNWLLVNVGHKDYQWYWRRARPIALLETRCVGTRSIGWYGPNIFRETASNNQTMFESVSSSHRTHLYSCASNMEWWMVDQSSADRINWRIASSDGKTFPGAIYHFIIIYAINCDLRSALFAFVKWLARTHIHEHTCEIIDT